VVVELRSDDVVLARESWRCGDTRIVLPTVRPKAATAALVGNEAPVAIGRQQGVDEHERATGKFARGLIGAEDAWWWLLTVMPCIAGAGEDSGGRMWIGSSGVDKGSRGIGCRG
jgi:hypothetical protein